MKGTCLPGKEPMCGKRDKGVQKVENGRDYRESNKIIIDKVFDTPRVGEIVDIIGNKNKYYSL
jgi:hypothetical protein